jgi:class 3 adenylate cyclase/predicted ATPase
MDFVAVVDQTIALLRQRGRLTYGTLKRQFQLDDAALDDLKDELIAGQRLAVDEDGKVLVWTGGMSSAPTTTSPLPITSGVAPAQVGGTLVVPPTPGAERRQLTVMFCDLVDSTRLSSQLDPEDWRDVVRAYQRMCTDVIQRYDGHIAQLLGDGLLVYFGYPQAHEDDAQRAVRAGLGMLAALGDLNTGLQHATGVQLAIRVGVHTGLVVVGEMGGQGRQEQLALGEVPNVCARIEGLAAPNTLAISDATYRLVQGYVQCRDLGAHALRGVPASMHLYRVLSETGASSRLEVTQPRGFTPLVGRESEVALLLERWEQAKAGHGQVVLLTGDAGIGKSRLVHTLKDHTANEPHTRWECRSVEYAQNTALYPLTELFQRLLQWQHDATPDEKFAHLEQALSQYLLPLEATVPLLAPVLSLPCPEDRYAPLALSPQRQRQKTLETMVAILLELAAHQPVLFILEDLHWTDPTTLEWLNLVLDQTPTAAMLVLLTCRPHFQPAWHHRSYITAMTLPHLSPVQVEQIVNRMIDGKTFPHEVLAPIVEKTDGVPLFVEELMKAILESGQLTVRDGHYECTGAFATFTIPATLQDSLMARLDRLVTAKAVAQYAAVIGRQFPYALLQAVSQLDEATLQRELGRLVGAEIVYQRGLPPHSTYVFKHALIQDAAYASLLKSTRQHYHQRIAQVLEAQFPETTAAQPELLAYHLTEAGLMGQAIPYWQRAGERAVQHSANVEAISHLTQALALLQTLPATPAHAQHELEVHLALGTPLVLTKGHAAPEVETTYARAYELCQQLGDTPQLFSALLGLRRYYFMRGELPTARDLAEQLLRLAQRLNDRGLVVRAHHTLEEDLLFLGEFAQVCAHAEQGMALYDPTAHRTHMFRYGNDSGVGCRVFGAQALWALGYPDQALQRSDEALAWAQELAHPFNLVFALTSAARLHLFRREPHRVLTWADAAVALAREQSFAQFLAQASMLRGWALAEQGQVAAGLAQIRQGMAAWRATGAHPRPFDCAWLAGVYEQMAEPAEGLRVLAEAQAVAETRREQFWEAELHRLRGALVLQSGGRAQPSGVSTPQMEEAEAERCFCQALDIARRQQAKSLELRAAMSLSRLWQRQGKRAEAYALLAPVYGWFTEGFDTADLQEARVLLDELGG